MTGAVIGAQLGLDATQWFATMNRVDATIGSYQSRMQSVGVTTQAVFNGATILGLAAGWAMVSRNLDDVITRYNTLRGLDQGVNFYNAQNQVDALGRGLGNVATRAEAASQAIRFLSAGSPMTSAQYQTIGAFARGQLLSGESRSIEEGLHAAELYITGGRSQILHRMGVMVNPALAYRQHAQDYGVGPMDLTSQQRMEIRTQEFFSATGAINAAQFGSSASASAFQSMDRFMRDVSDNRIRAQAGAIEELAKSFGLLADKSSGVGFGQALAVVQPLALGAAGAGYFGFRGAHEAYGFNQTIGMGTERIGLMQGQQAAFLAEGQQAKQLLMAEQAAQATLASQYQLQAQTAIFGTTGYSPLGSKLLGQAKAAGAAEIRLGQQAVAVEAQAAARAASLAAPIAAVQGQVAGANTALISSSNFGATMMALSAAVGIGVAAWTAYTTALRNVRQAHEELKSVAIGGIKPAVGIIEAARGGMGPQGLIERGEAAGLTGSYLGQWESLVSGGATEAQMGMGLTRLLTEQKVGEITQEEIDEKATAMYGPFWKLSGAYTNLGMQRYRDTAKTELEHEARLQVMRAQSAGSRGIAKQLDANAARSGEEYDENWAAMQEDIASRTRNAQYLEDAARAAGIDPGEIDYLRQEQIAGYKATLNYRHKGADGSYDPDTPAMKAAKASAAGNIIAYQQSEEERRKSENLKKENENFAKRLDQSKKDMAVDVQMAQQRDQMLGANLSLLRETNAEAALKANANRLVNEYGDAVKQGKEQLFLQAHSIDEVNAANRLLAVSSLDLARRMKDAQQAIIGGIPGMTAGAVNYEQAQISGQAGLYGAMAGKNSLLAGAQSALGGFRSLGPQYAAFQSSQSLLAAMKSIRGGGNIPAGFSGGMLDYLKQFKGLAEPDQLSAIAAMAGDLGQQRTSLVSSTYGAFADYEKWKSTLMGMDNTPENRAYLKKLQESGSVSQIQLYAGEAFAWGNQFGVLDPHAAAALGKEIGPKNLAAGAAMAGGQLATERGMLTQGVNYQLALIGSLGTLRQSVDALNATMRGTPTAPPSAEGLPPIAAGQSSVVDTPITSLYNGSNMGGLQVTGSTNPLYLPDGADFFGGASPPGLAALPAPGDDWNPELARAGAYTAMIAQRAGGNAASPVSIGSPVGSGAWTDARRLKHPGVFGAFSAMHDPVFSNPAAYSIGGYPGGAADAPVGKICPTCGGSGRGSDCSSGTQCVDIPCPTCGGSGYIDGAGEMSGVPYSFSSEQGKLPKKKKGSGDMILGNLAQLPVSAYSSGSAFLKGGGIEALLSPMLAGNPIAQIGLKLIESRLFSQHQQIPQPVPVAIVEVKDTAMDVFNLTQSRIAYSDIFSRRQVIAHPLTLRKGS